MKKYTLVLLVCLYSGNSFSVSALSTDVKFIAEIRPGACEIAVTSSSGLAGEVDFGFLTVSEINDSGSLNYLGKKYLRSLRSKNFSIDTVCDAPSRTAVMFSELRDRRVVISGIGAQAYAVAMSEVNNEKLGYLSFRLSGIEASAPHLHLPVSGILSTDKEKWMMRDFIVQSKSDITYISVREGMFVAKPGVFKSIKYNIEAELYVDGKKLTDLEDVKLTSTIPLSLVYL